MVGRESKEVSRERGKGREEEDRERKVITWLEVRAMKKEEKEEKGERGRQREKSHYMVGSESNEERVEKKY